MHSTAVWGARTWSSSSLSSTLSMLLTKDAHRTRYSPLGAAGRLFAFGDNFHSLDLRLSRSFVFQERWRLSLIGEVFNVYNKANLTRLQRRSDERCLWPAYQPGDAGVRVWRAPCVSTGHESRLLGRSHCAEAGLLRSFGIRHKQP